MTVISLNTLTGHGAERAYSTPSPFLLTSSPVLHDVGNEVGAVRSRIAVGSSKSQIPGG